MRVRVRVGVRVRVRVRVSPPASARTPSARMPLCPRLSLVSAVFRTRPC